MLNNKAIENNHDALVTARETTVSNAEVHFVALPDIKWLTEPVLRFMTQDFQSQFNPEGKGILMVCPTEFQ